MNSNDCRWRETWQVQLIAIYLFKFEKSQPPAPCCGYHNTYAHNHITQSDDSFHITSFDCFGGDDHVLW